MNGIFDAIMSRKIINAYPRFKEFKDLATAGDNVAAVRKGLDFLRFVGREYVRKQVYDHFEWDGDDFCTREAEEILANVLRNDRTPKECVEMAQKEIAEIEAMEAYDDYCLAFFDNVHEAMDFRLADAARYIEEMDRQIERHSKDYRKDLEDGHFEVFCALGKYNALDDLLEKKVDYLMSLGDEKGIEKVVEEFLYMPSVSAFVVNGLINDGKDEEAIVAIDKVLAVFRSDRFTATAQLHLKKVLLLERKGDRMGVAEEYRRVFRQQLSNKRLYFESMKEMVPKEMWDEFVVKAFDFNLINGILRAGGDTRSAVMLDSGYMWMIPVPVALILAFLLPAVGATDVRIAFAAITLLMNAKIIWALLIVKRGKWARNMTRI